MSKRFLNEISTVFITIGSKSNFYFLISLGFTSSLVMHSRVVQHKEEYSNELGNIGTLEVLKQDQTDAGQESESNFCNFCLFIQLDTETLSSHW